MIRRLIHWAGENVAIASITAGLVLFAIDALARAIAWSWFGVLLPAFSLGWR